MVSMCERIYTSPEGLNTGLFARSSMAVRLQYARGIERMHGAKRRAGEKARPDDRRGAPIEVLSSDLRKGVLSSE